MAKLPTHPSWIFLWTFFLLGGIVLWLDLKHTVDWEDVLVEANGLIFDIFFLGILFYLYEEWRQKNDRIQRQKELIGSYRRLKKKSSFHRIQFAVRQMNSDHFTEIELFDCYLPKAEFENVSLHKAKMDQVVLNQANLKHSNLSMADLTKAQINEAHLNGANLHKANLQFAEMRESILISANLRGANLSLSELNRAKLHHANFIGANLNGADLSGAELYHTDFRGAILENATLIGVDWNRSNLSNVRLKGAKVDVDFFQRLNRENVIGAPQIIQDYENVNGVLAQRP